MRRSTLLLLPLFALAACSTDQAPQTPLPTTAPTTPPGSTATAMPTPPAQPDLGTWTPEPAPSGAAGDPRGLDLDPDDVDLHDPVQVAAAFAVTMLTPDTRIDRSPADLSRRAARWASDEYAEQLRADRPAGGGAEWVALGERQGYLSVRLHTHPAVKAGLVEPTLDQLAVEVPILGTVTAHDADLPERELTALVSLHRTDPDAPWRVYDWHQEDYR